MVEELVSHLHAMGFVLEEAQVFPQGAPEFWHAAILNSEKFPVSGGFGREREFARKVAVAEYLERSTVRSIGSATQEERAAWGLNIIPTACGFAAGFDLENTVRRSLNEAVERWVMSKWIDDYLQIQEFELEDLDRMLDPVSLHLIQQFDAVRFFKKDVVLSVHSSMVVVEVAQTMGFLDGGIFPGSSAQYVGGSIWQHALLESYRHLLAARNNPERDQFPSNKVRFFARNADIAIEQIGRAKNQDWPIPVIRLHRNQSFSNGGYFLARTIIDGWRPWNEGPLERFLY